MDFVFFSNNARDYDIMAGLYMCSDCCNDCMKLVNEDSILGDKVDITGDDNNGGDAA